METGRLFGLWDHISSFMTWRYIKTSRFLSFSLLSAQYLMRIRAHRPFPGTKNCEVSCLPQQDRLWILPFSLGLSTFLSVVKILSTCTLQNSIIQNLCQIILCLVVFCPSTTRDKWFFAPMIVFRTLCNSVVSLRRRNKSTRGCADKARTGRRSASGSWSKKNPRKIP